MTTITLTGNVEQARGYTPFCDRNFKFVRAVADSVSRLCLAIFYKIISLCCWVVSARLGHHYGSLARYQFFRANIPSAYLEFGNEIVDFCINSSTLVKERVKGSEYEALQTMYGKKAIEQWSQIGTEQIPLQKEKLARKEKGFCVGGSFDYISQYLQKIRSGNSPLEAVKLIAGRYVAGAPVEAQLAQIFYEALDPFVGLLKFSEEMREMLRAERKKIAKEALSDEKRRQIEEKLKQMDPRAILMEEAHSLRVQREQLVAAVFGLKLQRTKSYHYEQIEKLSKVDAENLIQQLPIGAYGVSLQAQKEVHHAIVFIKTSEGPNFMMDLNLGTLAVESAKSTERFWSVARDLYLKEGACDLHFSSYGLSA